MGGRVASAAALTIVLVGTIGVAARETPRTDRAPVLWAESLTGNADAIQLPAAGIGHPTVLVFFASWCGQCGAELLQAQYAHTRLGNRVNFVGVNFSDQRSRALELLDLEDVTFPAVSDQSGVIAKEYGVAGMPATVFVSASGHIVGRHHGLDDALTEQVHRNFGIQPLAGES